MKIKYYLRGLGTGIIVTAIILTISNSIRNNEERMKQISGQMPSTAQYQTDAGTVRETEKAQIQPSDKASQEHATGNSEQPSTQATSEHPSSTQPSTQPASEQAASTQAASVSEGKSEPAVEKTSESSTSASEITISFRSVNSSETAAQLLEDAGLVDNWREFNTFLMNNGYDRRISNGTFTFNGKESFEELAKIITNGR
ncbi:MAG: hypothetical protein ACI4EJ_09675 [Bacteroides sp.]